MMKPIFVFSFDEANAMPVATALRSLAEANRNGWPLEVYLLAGAVSENTREKVWRSVPEGAVSILWMSVNPAHFSSFVEKGSGTYLSAMAYARLLIPQLLPENVRRVLYLDADIIVLDDLRPLWETDLDGAVLGAVADSSLPEAIKLGRLSPDQVPRVQDYFNSGVLLIDLTLWREKQISENALIYITQHPGSLYPDQDALNAVCDKLWCKLDQRWNFQSHLSTRISQMEPNQRPAIVHFVTKVKPWIATMPSLNAQFYDSYRSRTYFARTLPERISDNVRRFWTNTKALLKRQPLIRDTLQRARPAAASWTPKRGREHGRNVQEGGAAPGYRGDLHKEERVPEIAGGTPNEPGMTP